MRPDRKGQADLWAVSVLLLFFELICIRWLTSNVRILAYFSNVVLISCFLGFGVGCIVRKRTDVFPAFPWLLAIWVYACRFFEGIKIGNPGAAKEYIWGTDGVVSFYWVVPAFYILTALLFVAIGQRLSRDLDRCTPLRGYTINIIGSLTGTLLFAGCSFVGATPTVWFALCFGLTVWLLRETPRWMVAGLVLMMGSGWIIHRQEREALWSPYYKIQAHPVPLGEGSFELAVNHDYHQFALNLSNESVAKTPDARPWRAVYDFPYNITRRPATEVLVLGAGTGNDVAAAVRAGASSVDAVELDPVIFRLGKSAHPEKVYDNPNVHVIVQDARYFLRASHGAYDRIVMGWLDSHRLFSSMSNIRQDNFVYTVEAMRQARTMLKDDGLLVISFAVGTAWMGSKLYGMLSTAFGHAPKVFAYPDGGYGGNGHIFVIGKNSAPTLLPLEKGFVDYSEMYSRLPLSAIPTDDWPYLYYKDKTLTREYVQMMVMLILLSLVVIAFVVPRGRAPMKELVVFFLLGAGFMLLETRNISALALVFGSTWIVTSIVVSAILIMILIANLLVEKGWAPTARVTWSLLLATLIAAACIHEATLPGGPWLRGWMLAGGVSLTFLFAGIIFARCFEKAHIPSLALGVNVFGAVVGGGIEYLNLLFGLQSLLWIAVGIYASAWMFSRSQK